MLLSSITSSVLKISSSCMSSTPSDMSMRSNSSMLPPTPPSSSSLGSSSSSTSYPLSGQSFYIHLHNFVSLVVAIDDRVVLNWTEWRYRSRSCACPTELVSDYDLGVLYNTCVVWECYIIQWYNTTGIILQLYIHTYSDGFKTQKTRFPTT